MVAREEYLNPPGIEKPEGKKALSTDQGTIAKQSFRNKA
jgi:hypothetical protein